jgi:hypothetical protein
MDTFVLNTIVNLFHIQTHTRSRYDMLSEDTVTVKCKGLFDTKAFEYHDI